MGEYANQPATGGPAVAQTGGATGGAAADQGGPTKTDPGTGTGTEPAPTQPQGGGGAQADQEKDEGQPATGEITFPDGSRTRFTEEGRIEHTDASGRTGRWSGSNEAYWDPQTNEWMPEGWGDPGFANRDTASASDWEHHAGEMNDSRRLAEQAGERELASRYQDAYDNAVAKARELGASEGRR
jgi:hypothetical protein